MTPTDQFAVQIVHGLWALSLRVGILLLAVWGLSMLMRRGSSALRHLLWTISIIAVLAMPVFELVSPTWQVALLPEQRALVPADRALIPPTARSIATEHENIEPAPMASDENRVQASTVSTALPIFSPPSVSRSSQHPVGMWVLAIWLSGLSLVEIYGLIGALAVRRLGGRARIVNAGPLWAVAQESRQQLGISRNVRLLISETAGVPMAWGIFRPRILLPAQASRWSADQSRSVLLHELAHIRRWDCLTQFLAFVATAIHWFNPLVWLAGQRMRIERERACDDMVINHGASAADYAEHLLQIARNLKRTSPKNVAAVAMARRSGLAERLRAVLGEGINRHQLSARAKLAGIIATLAVLVPICTIHLVNKIAAHAVAQAAETIATTTTAPAGDEEGLPPMPSQLPSDRVAIQVLSPKGPPMRVDSIKQIMVWMGPIWWGAGTTPPKVLARYAHGWILVEDRMFSEAKPGQRIGMVFINHGVALAVNGHFPKSDSRRIIFKALAYPYEVGVDLSSGPSAAHDEVAGKVVGPDGKPVAGATVSFPRAAVSTREPSVTTGPSGVFRFPNFLRFNNANYVYAELQKDGYATRLLTDLPVGHGFLVHLYNDTQLKGTLVGTDGAPAANATLRITTSKPTVRPDETFPVSPLTLFTQTDSHGAYDIPLEPGHYQISITAPNGVGYDELDLASGQVAALPEKLKPGITLKLIAIDAITNKPASGIHFYIADNRANSILPMDGTQRTTSADGTAAWTDLPRGPVSIMVSSKIYSRWWTDKTTGQVSLQHIGSLNFDLNGPMPPVTVHVEPGVQASGLVLSPNGRPVANATVDIAGLHSGSSQYARRTDATGHFKLTFPVLDTDRAGHKKEAKYAMVASDSKHRWANATSDWFSPKPGQKLSFTLKMTPGAWVRGRVIRGDGQPVAQLEVQGQNPDQLDRMYYNPRTLTDDNGNFVLGPMRAGKYTIHFCPEPGRVVGFSDQAPTLTVVDGEYVDVGNMTYNGSKPKPVSPWYDGMYGASASPPANVNWRHVTPTGS